jgi:hypothetical protein
MATVRLSEQQYRSIQNILNPQPVTFEEIEGFLSLSKSLRSPRVAPNGSVEIDLSDEDLELLHALLQEGSIRIKEIPAALDLLRALTPVSQDDGPLYEEPQSARLSVLPGRTAE